MLTVPLWRSVTEMQNQHFHLSLPSSSSPYARCVLDLCDFSGHDASSERQEKRTMSSERASQLV
jgi:hypothetical protein